MYRPNSFGVTSGSVWGLQHVILCCWMYRPNSFGVTSWPVWGLQHVILCCWMYRPNPFGVTSWSVWSMQYVISRLNDYSFAFSKVLNRIPGHIMRIMHFWDVLIAVMTMLPTGEVVIFSPRWGGGPEWLCRDSCTWLCEGAWKYGHCTEECGGKNDH